MQTGTARAVTASATGSPRRGDSVARGVVARGVVARVAALVVALVAALGLALSAAPAAHAHSELLSSSPADGESLTAPPANVTLQFNEAISPAGLQVVAQGPDGPVTLGTPIIEGASVIAPWPQDAPGGNYRFAYRVVSADGHPIDGSISFSYTAAAASPGADASAAPIEPTDLGQSAVASQNTAAPQPESGFPWWVAIVAVILGVGIGAVIARTMGARAAKGQ